MYFTPDFLEFFKELAANNHKEWFDANRSRYEKEVREPFKALVGDYIPALVKHDPDLDQEPKNCIFRINRDIRFSKDKSPYKLNISAVISRNGRKDMENPGIYIQLDPEHTRFFCGMYMPPKEVIERVRQKLADEGKRWNKILRTPAFSNTFSEVQGEKNKVLPKEFKEAAASEPMIFHKSWYVFEHYPPETVLRDDLVDFLVQQYLNAKPFKDFLQEAADGN